jgi:hypothetical protein
VAPERGRGRPRHKIGTGGVLARQIAENGLEISQTRAFGHLSKRNLLSFGVTSILPPAKDAKITQSSYRESGYQIHYHVDN